MGARTAEPLYAKSLRLPLLEHKIVAPANAAAAHPKKTLQTHDALVLRVAALGEHGELALDVEGLEADAAGVGLLSRKTVSE